MWQEWLVNFKSTMLQKENCQQEGLDKRDSTEINIMKARCRGINRYYYEVAPAHCACSNFQTVYFTRIYFPPQFTFVWLRNVLLMSQYWLHCSPVTHVSLSTCRPLLVVYPFSRSTSNQLSLPLGSISECEMRTEMKKAFFGIFLKSLLSRLNEKVGCQKGSRDPRSYCCITREEWHPTSGVYIKR